jgi:hypothetical protein
MDYPLQPASELVGPVRRGDREPSVGALIDFARCPGRGLGGIGLGVQSARPTSELSYLPLLIQGGAALVIQGADLGLPGETVPLPDELRAAMAAGGHRIGLTATIRADALEVTLRARDPGADAPVELVHAWPIDAAQRQRLLECPGTLLARDGYQAITPYFDDARRPGPDLTLPAPPNPWRFGGWDRLEGLYRARRRLGSEAPASLRELEAELLAAVDRDAGAQNAAMKAYDERIAGVLRDVDACSASEDDKATALSALEAQD